jgi:hypothetical protein
VETKPTVVVAASAVDGAGDDIIVVVVVVIIIIHFSYFNSSLDGSQHYKQFVSIIICLFPISTLRLLRG